MKTHAEAASVAQDARVMARFALKPVKKLTEKMIQDLLEGFQNRV